MRTLALFPLLAFATSGCALSPDDAASSTSEVRTCSEVTTAFRFPNGSDGHADPLGAAAAGQARAGKVTKPADIAQPADARHKVRTGDFVLANEKIAVYIEAEGTSDGYFPFGGEILGVEPIGANGRPTGVSYYGETAIMFGLQTVAPEKVSVIADGSDGHAAIVRAAGILKLIPVLDPFVPFFPDHYDLPIALDYVLEPGATKVTMRVNLANTGSEAIDFAGKQNLGLFQRARSQSFTEGNGFAKPTGEFPYVAYDSGESSFMLRSPLGPLSVFLEESGLQALKSPSFTLDPCATKAVDYLELIAGGPGIDGVLESKRKNDGDTAWREIRGTVKETGGGALAGAMVHATSKAGYLTRATADKNGAYVMHVPPGDVDLTATMLGWATPAATPIADGVTTADLSLPHRATIDVTATDADTKEALPVRVQIVPDGKNAKAPASFGLKEEPDDRLYREYVMSGKVSLPVPPGGHRVIVTRGYEYEVHDAPVLVEAGKTTKVTAELKHSVDTTGVMCGDFHIHSIYSVDSTDPVEKKVRGAIADGLEVPVSSEHEYVVDFQPVIQKLGMTKWAYGIASEELTTFGWGHMGVFPLAVQPDLTNSGAIDWTYKSPPEIFPEILARPDHPIIIINHPRGDTGYFDLAGFDRETGAGAKGLWTEAFSAVEVFNDGDLEKFRDGPVADWFALLNAGKHITATGSSDSHDLSTNPVGYPRTCMQFGHDDPTRLRPETVRDTLKAGAAVISGGISMTAQGPDGVSPGGTSTAGTYKVVVATPGWLSATSLEVIIDGITTQTLALDPAAAGAGPGKRWELNVPVAAASSRANHWVVFHAKGDTDLAPLHPGRNPFAVSNPIFF